MYQQGVLFPHLLDEYPVNPMYAYNKITFTRYRSQPINLPYCPVLSSMQHDWKLIDQLLSI